MKNKREISKIKTRKLILLTAKKLIKRNGVINLNTLSIAKEAKIAHGTVFAHFPDKDALIHEVFRGELVKIAKELHKFSVIQTDLRSLLSDYLDYLSSDEKFFIVISKEFPFLSNNLQRNILATESIIRKIFFNKIQDGISCGKYKEVDITMTLSFLFSTINYYLNRREFFINEKGSIIEKKKNKIIRTFYTFIKQ